MIKDLIPVVVVCIYLGSTTLLGLWQTRKVKKARDYTVSQMSVWRVATFLAGYSLGGGATFGVAGDTIKFGLTYMVWFPLSVSLGWIVTGLLFSKPYFKMNGITVPSFLAHRFDEATRLSSSLSTLLYAVFVVVLEIYTLAILIIALFPGMSMPLATLISLLINVASVSFSGILGASVNNSIHSIMMLGSFTLALIVLWQAVGGWSVAIDKVLVLLPSVANPGVNQAVWLSTIGMGWGIAGQLLMGKVGRLGGISIISQISASCRSEKEAVKAFLLAGAVAGIVPFLASTLGIFTAAYLGENFTDLPVYSAIGLSLTRLNPLIGGLILAAVIAGILSAFGPTAIVLSSVFTDDIAERFVQLSDWQKRILFPLITIVVSVACSIFVAFVGVKDILPFLYTTAFPCTVPITVVVAFGIYSQSVTSKGAFWAIVLGVSTAMIWGLLLDNPYGIPNMHIAYLVPTVVMTADLLVNKYWIKTSLLTERR